MEMLQFGGLQERSVAWWLGEYRILDKDNEGGLSSLYPSAVSPPGVCLTPSPLPLVFIVDRVQ